MLVSESKAIAIGRASRGQAQRLFMQPQAREPHPRSIHHVLSAPGQPRPLPLVWLHSGAVASRRHRSASTRSLMSLLFARVDSPDHRISSSWVESARKQRSSHSASSATERSQMKVSEQTAPKREKMATTAMRAFRQSHSLMLLAAICLLLRHVDRASEDCSF